MDDLVDVGELVSNTVSTGIADNRLEPLSSAHGGLCPGRSGLQVLGSADSVLDIFLKLRSDSGSAECGQIGKSCFAVHSPGLRSVLHINESLMIAILKTVRLQ